MKYILSLSLCVFVSIMNLQASGKNLFSKKRKNFENQDVESVTQEFAKKVQISFKGINLTDPFRIIQSNEKLVVYSYEEYIGICERNICNVLGPKTAQEVKKELYRLANKGDVNGFDNAVKACMNLKSF
ncbi:MAG: hypothetical protein ACXWL2_00905 [Candidatus Chromulinivorax sp.]